ncbi:Serine/threonine-protein kinase 25 [Fukomys damarensis]|uniref:Serine/threonine-protein kinase 25 n=1 Tax=Fukomys damarensis TaxID=885580 RepID=A0A091DWN2_FUKDA|nr:Serine/threonine-protein kinase 25 [Fukomys damarensis]
MEPARGAWDERVLTTGRSMGHRHGSLPRLPNQHSRNPEELFTKCDHTDEDAFGEVYRSTDNHSRKVVAIKIINLEEAEDKIKDIQQSTMLSHCNSPYIAAILAPI